MVVLIARWGKGPWYVRSGKSSFDWQGLLARYAAALGLFIFMGAVLLLQVCQADFRWVGHGPGQYAHFIDDWYPYALPHFPLINQHYDEVIFHYFLCMPLHGIVDTIVIWWITLGLVKTSVFVFCWIVMRRFGLSAVLAFLAALFLFIGTSSICPWKYYIIFDSSNFLFFTVHSGRVAGLVMVLFWLLNFLREDEKSNPLGLLMILLAGIGTTAVSESSPLWVLALLPWMLNVRLQASPPRSLLIYGSIVTMLLLFALPFKPMIFIYVRALMVAVIFFACSWAFFVFLFKCFKEPEALSARRGVIALFASLVLGMTLMGNVLRDNPLCHWAYQKIGPLIGGVVYGDLTQYMFTEGAKQIGDFREIAAGEDFCLGLLPFIAYYGSILVMMAMIPYLYQRLGDKRSFVEERLYWVFNYLMAVMPLIFFVMNFTNLGTKRAWAKSRFLEVPVYVTILVFLYFFNRGASKNQRLLLGVVLAVYTIMPFLGSERPRQILENGKCIIESVRIK